MKIFNSTLLFVMTLLACTTAPVQIKADTIVTESETAIEINGVEFTVITIDSDDFVATLAMPGKISINNSSTGVQIQGYVDDNNQYQVTLNPASLVPNFIKSGSGIEKFLYKIIDQFVALYEIPASFPFTSSYEGYGSRGNEYHYARILNYTNVVSIVYMFKGSAVDENMTSYIMENLTVDAKL